MKIQISLISLFLLIISGVIIAQQSPPKDIVSKLIDLGEIKTGNEDFEGFEKLKPILKDVEIVMLGEQTHGDGAAFDTKVKLIKFLHQEMGFEILVFESGFYDCKKAWEEIEKGENVETALANSIFTLWSTTTQFKPLVTYVEDNLKTEKPLTVLGFDSQFTGPISKEHFLRDLRNFLKATDSNLVKSPEWFHFQLDIARYFDEEYRKKVKKKEIEQDTTYLNSLVQKLTKLDTETMFWKQAIQSCKVYLSGVYLGTDLRDYQMAQNLIWIKEQNPNKKIICWGATSHFLYNQQEVHLMKFPYNVVDNYYQKTRMMGDYIKQKYNKKVYTIGFIAGGGDFGRYSKRTLKSALPSSLETAISTSSFNNCFLPFTDLNLSGYESRPLGNQYMNTNITLVMDGVVYNRVMYPAYMNRNLLLEVYPTNKWIKPDTRGYVK